jgi:hypothetical protein
MSPSDFYLFGHLKQLWARREFPDPGAFFDAVQDILSSTEKLPWIGFFSLEWRDSSDVLQSMETALRKQTFHVKSLY